MNGEPSNATNMITLAANFPPRVQCVASDYRSTNITTGQLFVRKFEPERTNREGIGKFAQLSDADGFHRRIELDGHVRRAAPYRRSTSKTRQASLRANFRE